MPHIPPMLPAEIRLNEKQAEFVRLVADGTATATAAELAGFTPAYGFLLLKNPAVLAAIEFEVRRFLASKAGPRAIKFLYDVILLPVEDKTYSGGMRVDAAKFLAGVAGYVAPKAPAAGSDANKEPEAMSSDELHALVARLEDELAGRAKTVSEPEQTEIPPELADYM